MASLILVASLISAIISIYMIIYVILIPYISNTTQKKQKLPPGRTGWPLIGESLSYASNPAKFIRDRMSRHSSVAFRTRIAGEDMIVLGGSEGNKFIFSNDNKLFSPWYPKGVSKVFKLKANHLSTILKDHSFLKVDSVQKYVSVMDLSCRNELDQNWPVNTTVKVDDVAKKFTFALTCKLFINCDDKQLKDLIEPFFVVVASLISAPVNVPGTAYHAAMKAGPVVAETIRGIIRQRKTEVSVVRGNHGMVQAKDLITQLLLVTDKSGKFPGEDEIILKVISYLIASFVTTSNAITFVLSHLADHPHVYDTVLKEQQDIAKSKREGELLTWDDIHKMKYSWNVVCESLRLTSFSMAFKEAKTDFTYSGFNIPKGWKVMWTPHATHADPRYFSDPEKFDPTRFEKNGPQPYTFAPFGGGPNMCPGNAYTRIIMMVLVHNVVNRFKLEKMNPNEKIIYTPVPTPVEGLPMYLQHHKK